MLLPITGTIFSKKSVPVESTDENSIDFHLSIIKKIDSLLAEHEPETSAPKSFHAPPILPAPPPAPIEPRPPLNKTLSHRDVAWEPSIEPPRTMTQTMPEEFKTELSLHPEFKFITSQEFKDIIFQIRPPSEERVEILDLSSLVGDSTTFNKITSLTIPKNLAKEKPTISIINETWATDQQNKRTEVIDTRTLKQKIYEDALNNALKQAEQNEKKQLYFLSSKDHNDKKQKKLEIEQTYIPVDFEERSKELKEQQNEEEEEKKQQEQKIQKQLEHEHEKLEKLETKKAILEEKKQELKQKEKKAPKEDSQPTSTKRDIKKQEKEQKRLQRLEIRKARIEERRRKKEEKQELKTEQKQQRLRRKGKEKQTKQKTSGNSLLNKEKHNTSLELDEDIKKLLLMTDALLGELPEDVINRFMQSEDFELYEKVMNKYKIK
jgi:hypothetical protein